ncbi:MAG TPA: glycosyl hydrolase family 28 protein [Candidatus Sulfotelmatobacter sp.]|nr:glycosyl hydrolase family 28 protein [Candidatus Sulfotelmatobacter sp.]
MKDQNFSRRRWLASASTVAASAGAGLLAGKVSAAEPEKMISSTSPGARVYDIRDFGAKGDGVTVDTAALQAAIDACHQDQGGTVLVPAGTFVIGTTELKSNVTLHIAAAGILLGSDHGQDYFPSEAVPLEGDSTLEDGNTGLLFAVNAENITVEGPGMIDGRGSQFHGPNRGDPSPAGISGAQRPYHLMFYRCKNFRIQNVFLKNSAFHSMRIVQCTYGWFTGIHLRSRVISNNDGFHFISCERMHVSGCDIECQDDACALFGSCKFITVSDCSFSTRWSVFRFGGGTAENIAVSNCIIDTVFGCPIKIRGGEGNSRFENFSFRNLTMNHVTGPISIALGSHHRRHPEMAANGQTNPVAGVVSSGNTNIVSNSETNSLSRSTNNYAGGFAPEPTAEELAMQTGIVRNISFSGIRATVVKPFPLPESEHLSGYNPGEKFSCIGLNAVGAGFLENISFDDVHVTFPGGGTAEQGAVRDVPKAIGEYYAAGIFPAWAIYARQVRGLTLNNVRFEIAGSDLRPAIVFDHVNDASVNGLSVQGDAGAESVLRFIESQDVLMSATRLLTPAKVFLQVEGAANRNINVDGGDISKAGEPLAFQNGASKKSVKLRG